MIALFFDTETTGFKSKDFTPEIVQIGAILQDTDSKRVLGELNLIVRAKEPIPEKVSTIHGITDDISARFGVTSDIADNMFALMAAKADLLVAHNIDFDLGIIDGAWVVSRPIAQMKAHYCTMRNCSRFDDTPRRHAGRNEFTKLTDAYKYFHGVDFENAHDAMADVRACRDLYFKLIEA